MNPKQQRFADEYLVDHNASQAAIRAGYSSKGAEVQGHRLLSNVNVKQYIQERSQSIADKLGIDTAFVLEGIRDITLKTKPTRSEANAAVSLKGFERLGKFLKIFDNDDRQEQAVNIQIVQF